MPSLVIPCNPCLHRLTLREKVCLMNASPNNHNSDGCSGAVPRLGLSLAHALVGDESVVLGSWGKPMRDAVGNEERWKRAPYAYPRS